MSVQAVLADGTVLSEPGKLNFVDLALQPETGTQQLRAVLPNPKHVLLPGQFVRVRLLGLKIRSEEHTSELQSQSNLVCRLLLEKKNHSSHHPHSVDLPGAEHAKCYNIFFPLRYQPCARMPRWVSASFIDTVILPCNCDRASPIA